MNLEEILKPSKSIEISFLDTNNRKINFHTLIDQGFLYSNNSFSIITPRYNSLNYPFQHNDIITIYFTTIIKNSKKVFTFRAQILKKIKEDNLIEDIVQKISEIEEIQRRNSFRLPITKNATVFIDDKEYEVLSKNISATGLRFVVNKRLHIDTMIKVAINFEDNMQLITEAKVIQSILQKDSQYKYDTKVEFIDLENSEKDKLINFIFSKQTEMLKKTQNSDAANNIYHMIYGEYDEKRNKKDIIQNVITIISSVSWILLFLMIIFFVKASPETSYGIGRFFNNAYRLNWNSNLLNVTFMLSVIQFIITGIGLYLCSIRMKRTTDKYNISFIINISISVITLFLTLSLQLN
jgi:c-di-GMP-binding flagellar brake protein YcgR